MKIAFWKMHGASNDFIMVDDRNLSFPTSDRKWIASICARRTGVGCEGLILIQPSNKSSFRMRFFNPDGSEVDMCGNGARCVARLAHGIGAAPASMKFETLAGMLSAEIVKDLVRITLTDPVGWDLDRTLEIDGRMFKYGFVNTGVPHFVALVEDLDTLDVARYGAAVRYHSQFAPKGTNANFISVTGPASIRVRTYERGVEGETLACGTGISASALVAARSRLVKPPVQVTAASGDILTVDFRLSGTTAEKVTLLGPAVYTFTGTLDYPA